VLGSPYTLTAVLTTFLTTASLGTGTWKVTFNCEITFNSAGTPFAGVTIAAGTATATFSGPIGCDRLASPGATEDTECAGFECIATVTGAGTLVFQGAGNGGGTASVVRATGRVLSENCTGYTAVKIA
jgi:hypothetical protein